LDDGRKDVFFNYGHRQVIHHISEATAGCRQGIRIFRKLLASSAGGKSAGQDIQVCSCRSEFQLQGRSESEDVTVDLKVTVK